VQHLRKVAVDLDLLIKSVLCTTARAFLRRAPTPLSRSLGCKRCLSASLLDTFGRGGFGGDEAAAAKSGARLYANERQPLFSGCVESEASSSRQGGPHGQIR
jgi:hypothetical protein